MKKILAIVMALCLTIALTTTAFAKGSPTLGDNSPTLDDGLNHSPTLDPNGGVNSDTTSKYSYSAKDANGLPVVVNVQFITSGDVYDEVKAYGVKGVFSISVISSVTGSITLDLYCPGASSSSKVIIRDEWELLEGANLKVNGNRVQITADADALNKYHYIAVVDNFDAIDVDTPKEGGDNVSDEEGDDVNVNDNDNVEVDNVPVTDNAPTADRNPITGVAFAVVPMLVAAAAVVVSKKR